MSLLESGSDEYSGEGSVPVTREEAVLDIGVSPRRRSRTPDPRPAAPSPPEGTKVKTEQGRDPKFS